MKRFITILLLLVMTGQVSRMYTWKSAELNTVDLNDKKDIGGKEDKKDVKFYIANPFSGLVKEIDNLNFISHPSLIIQSPVIDHRTPPPDGSTAV